MKTQPAIVAGQAAAQQDPALLKALAEASAWIVTLHGPDRTEAVERGFRRWLEESPVHARAFEYATDTWAQAKAGVRRSARLDVSMPRIGSLPRRRRSRIWPIAASLAALAAGFVFYWQPRAVSTEVGERRQIVLDDGSQVSLNTESRLVKRYTGTERRIRLESGEALFDVMPDEARPFIVEVGNREVRALGTSFLVRRDAARIAVTLVEGRIAVSAEGGARDDGPAAILVPGERVTFVSREQPTLDHPELEKLTAWQQGVVNIDNMTLRQAIAEMDRYSLSEFVVEGPAADIRVSGVFRITDAESMAKAVAVTHGLQLREEGRQIILSGNPQAPSESRIGDRPAALP